MKTKTSRLPFPHFTRTVNRHRLSDSHIFPSRRVQVGGRYGQFKYRLWEVVAGEL